LQDVVTSDEFNEHIFLIDKRLDYLKKDVLENKRFIEELKNNYTYQIYVERIREDIKGIDKEYVLMLWDISTFIEINDPDEMLNINNENFKDINDFLIYYEQIDWNSNELIRFQVVNRMKIHIPGTDIYVYLKPRVPRAIHIG